MGKENVTPTYNRRIVTLNDLFWEFLYSLKKLRGVTTRTALYVRSNKRTLLWYSAFYFVLWLGEWVWGVQIEITILAGCFLCFCTDLYLRFVSPVRPSHPLAILKKRVLLKKRLRRAQRPAIAALSTFYAEVRRFISNPSLRIARTLSARLFSWFWLAASATAVLDFLMAGSLIFWILVHQPLFGTKPYPASYADFVRLSELMVVDLLSYCGIDYIQSHVINWLFSLLAFLALVSRMSLLEGQNLNTFVWPAFKRLFVTLLVILSLEALKASLMDFALVNQGNLKPEYETGFYIFSNPLWWITYYRTFEYLHKKKGRTFVEIFNVLLRVQPLPSCHSTELTQVFINKIPMIIASTVFCAAFLLAKILLAP